MIRAAAVTTAAFSMSAGIFLFAGARAGFPWAEPMALAAAGAGMAAASFFLSPRTKLAGKREEKAAPAPSMVATQRVPA